MLERVSPHAPGRFTRCRQCASEPRHVVASGRHSREPVLFILTAARHTLECRCGARTARHDSLTAAETEWGADYAQLPLPLRAPRRRKWV